MAEHSTGMAGGTMSGGIAIGKQQGQTTTVQEGGIGHIGSVGQAGVIGVNRDAAAVNMGSQAKKKPPTSSELVVKLVECECSEATQKGFKDKAITGRIFMSQFDNILKTLNITDEFEVMKLQELRDELSQ